MQHTTHVPVFTYYSFARATRRQRMKRNLKNFFKHYPFLALVLFLCFILLLHMVLTNVQ